MAAQKRRLELEKKYWNNPRILVLTDGTLWDNETNKPVEDK